MGICRQGSPTVAFAWLSIIGFTSHRENLDIPPNQHRSPSFIFPGIIRLYTWHRDVVCLVLTRQNKYLFYARNISGIRKDNFHTSINPLQLSINKCFYGDWTFFSSIYITSVCSILSCFIVVFKFSNVLKISFQWVIWSIAPLSTNRLSWLDTTAKTLIVSAICEQSPAIDGHHCCRRL